ncbi:MAG: hypothetical protein O7C59_06125, partial [Rickettsia endosymbiont of Ixodes persulcatus]|nr:hypothetical protein [Rickettsia endosymbiont of Ixodes persulcatus]
MEVDTLKFNKNNNTKDLIQNTTGSSLQPIPSMKGGLYKEAEMQRTAEMMAKIMNPKRFIREVNLVPDKLVIDNKTTKIQKLAGWSGLRKEAEQEYGMEQIRMIRGVNQALKSALPDLAESILGRPLTQEEIINGCLGPLDIAQQFADKAREPNAKSIVKAIKNKDVENQILQEVRNAPHHMRGIINQAVNDNGARRAADNALNLANLRADMVQQEFDR